MALPDDQVSRTHASESTTTRLRLLAAGFALILALAGAVLAVVGVRGLHEARAGSILTILAGAVMVAYSARLATRARRNDFPDWIRDLLHSLSL